MTGDNSNNEVRATLACKMENGQYCFYEKSIAKDKLLQTPKSEQKSEGEQQEGAGFKLVELVEGSTLLTPRSVEAEELRLALQSGLKWHNRTADVGNYVRFPMKYLCIGAFAFNILVGRRMPRRVRSINYTVGMVSCLPIAVARVLQIMFYKKANKQAKIETNGLLSASPYLVSTESVVEVKKILTWLESRDSVPCPAKMKLPNNKEEQSGDEK